MANETNNKQIVKRDITSKTLLAYVTKELTDGKGKPKFPPNYDVVGNLKVFELTLIDKTVNGVPYIKALTRASIEKVALEIVKGGLNVSKAQGYLIPYGKALTLDPGVYGFQRLAKMTRPEIGDFYGNVVLVGEKFEVEVIFGREVVVKHIPNIFEDIPENFTNVVGAYSTVKIGETEKGEPIYDSEIMTLKEIIKAANQRPGQDLKTYKAFPRKMLSKVVKKAHAKRLYNVTDDTTIVANNNNANDYDDETPVDIDNNDVEPIDITDYDVTEEEQGKAQDKPKEETALPTTEDFDDFDNALTEEQREIIDELVCSDCKNKVSEKVAEFSNKKYHRILCFECQKKQG